MRNRAFSLVRSVKGLLLAALVLNGGEWVMAQDQPRAGTPAVEVTTTTDFLSDDGWRQLPREERRRRSRASYIARFEPSGHPSIDRIAEYVDRYARVNIYDPRLTVFKVKAERVGDTTGTVVLSGEVLMPQHKGGVAETLEMLGFKVERNDIAVLPAAELGPKIYALATTGVATVRKEPRGRAEQVNSVGLGNWVRLLREARPEDVTNEPGRRSEREASPDSGKWFLAQTSEGYVGFVREDEISRREDLPQPDAMVLVPTTVTLTAEGGAKSEMVLPVGAFLFKVDEGTAGSAKYRLGHLEQPLEGDLPVVELGSPVFTEEKIMQLAKPILGVKYVWGGVTGHGIDCSGFTQFMLRTQGITLPRDAEEQATVGQIVAFGKDVAKLARPGDLVFFANGRGKISHIAMSLGGSRIIHSSGRNGVHVADLVGIQDGDDDAEPMINRVVFARRVVGQ